MLYTLTNQPLANGRPVQIGSNSVTILNRASHVFTVANFTSETSPVYSDPEGDSMSYIKILSLPTKGALTLSGNPVTVDQLIVVGNISAGNLVYTASNEDPASVGVFLFDVADVGSQSLSGLDDGVFTINAEKVVNQAPTCVGDNVIAKLHGVSHTFTVANFTTETTPAYSDPEGDAAYAVKILTLPLSGVISFNGSPISTNQIVLASEISAGLLTYTPDASITDAQSPSFTFAVADTGSKTYVALCLA